MQNQSIGNITEIQADLYVPVVMDEFMEKRCRCNSSTWLQIFGGIAFFGGVVTAIVTGGLWPVIGSVSVAVGGAGAFFTGWYKDRHSCSKCCCGGTSFNEDMLFENEKDEKKFRERNEAISRFIDDLDEHKAQTIDHDALELLNTIEINLPKQNTVTGKSLLTRIQNFRQEARRTEPLIQNFGQINMLGGDQNQNQTLNTIIDSI